MIQHRVVDWDVVMRREKGLGTVLEGMHQETGGGL